MTSQQRSLLPEHPGADSRALSAGETFATVGANKKPTTRWIHVRVAVPIT